MKEIFEKLMTMKEEDLDEYRKIGAFCRERKNSLAGIPAIIGLDDLTDSGHKVYKGAPMDQQMNIKLALDALIFNWLAQELEDLDPHYPTIAPAMSALAEKQFFINEEGGEPCKYREALDNKRQGS